MSTPASVESMDAQAWDERYSDSELVWGAPPNPVVVECTTALPHGRALDLACGEGRHALWLATRGWQVTGIDYSGVAIDKARRIASQSPRSVRERLRYVQGDVTNMDLEPGYDLILMIFLHLPRSQRRTLVTRAIEALEPEGTLVILGHDSRNLTDGVGGPKNAELLYTPDDLTADLAGRLDIDRAERRYRETDAGRAIDALVVARKPIRGD